MKRTAIAVRLTAASALIVGAALLVGPNGRPDWSRGVLAFEAAAFAGLLAASAWDLWRRLR